MEHTARAMLVPTIYGCTAEIQHDIIARRSGCRTLASERPWLCMSRQASFAAAESGPASWPLRFGTIRRLLPLSLLVALVITGCGKRRQRVNRQTRSQLTHLDRQKSPQNRPGEPPSRLNHLRRTNPHNRQSAQPKRPRQPRSRRIWTASSTYRDAKRATSALSKIRVRVYASRQQLCEEQRFLDEALGGFQPVAVKCEVVRVELTADEVPGSDRRGGRARAQRTLSARYRC
jgi:hypothetical protein